MGYMVTVLALIGKFTISFTYNSIYIITAEIHPTVIRNSSVSLCQTFARMGAIIAPNIQLLVNYFYLLKIILNILRNLFVLKGELYWYPMPFVIFGAFSAVSAVLFIIVMPETRNRKLPDTIEEFIQ